MEIQNVHNMSTYFGHFQLESRPNVLHSALQKSRTFLVHITLHVVHWDIALKVVSR